MEKTIEQKAKAYDEAIKRAKVFKEHLLEINDKGYVDEMDYIFPELKESEDEEIRKFLIQMAQNGHGENRDWWNKCVAWLEKQQKPIASSKFKVGDKVVHKGTGKIWTIHWYIKEDNVYSVKDSEGLIHIYSPDVLELIEQKPAEWSEKEENIINNICDYIQGHTNFSDSCKGDAVHFLKSLKPQKQWKPSKEQLNGLKEAIEFLGCTKTRREQLQSLYEQLKKLREE